MTDFTDTAALRDALVPLVQAHGRNPLPGQWSRRIPVLQLMVGDFSLVLGGPFATPPHGETFSVLEVHHAEKGELMYFQWGAAGGMGGSVVDGEWQAELLQSVESIAVGRVS